MSNIHPTDNLRQFYSPFCCVPLSDSLSGRAAAASDSLNLVIDAGNQLTHYLAENGNTAAVSSLVDALLRGAEYARDLLREGRP